MEKVAMNVEDLAKTLGISKPKAYELAHSHGFPCIRLGKRVIIPIAPFEQWLKERVSGEANLGK